MMKSILILISAIALLGCQTPSVEPDGSGVTILKNVEITSVQKPPFPSGVIATYSLIGVKNQNGDVIFLHAGYFGGNSDYPEIGSKCSAAMSEEYIKGQTKNDSLDATQKLPFVFDLICSDVLFNYANRDNVGLFERNYRF